MRACLLMLLLATGCDGRAALPGTLDQGLDSAPAADGARDAARSDAPGPGLDVGPADAASPDRWPADLAPSGPWVATAGTPGVAAHVVGRGIVSDHLGNSYVTGSYMGHARFGSTQLPFSGAQDLFVTQLTPAGEFLWITTVGGELPLRGVDIARHASGKLVVVGEFEGTVTFGGSKLSAKGNTDVFVAQLDPAGKLLWVRAMGGTDWDSVTAVAADAQGNVCVTGAYHTKMTAGSTVLTSQGGPDQYVVRLTAAGNVSWALSAGGAGDELAGGVAMTPAGDCWLVGGFNSAMTMGPWSLTAPTPPPNGWETDSFLARISPAGKVLSAQVLQHQANDVAVDASGQLTLVGSGVSVTRLAPAGKELWSIQLPAGAGLLAARPRLAMDGQGNSYVTADFRGTIQLGPLSLASAGEADVFAAKLSPAGDIVWVKAAGGASNDHPGDIAPWPGGGALVTGGFVGQASFGQTVLTAKGYEDLFVWQIPAGPSH